MARRRGRRRQRQGRYSAVDTVPIRTLAAGRGLTGRVNRNGSYTVLNVPAGDYYIVAVDRATQGELQDPRYLEALARVATRISVGADNVSQELNKTRVAK